MSFMRVLILGRVTHPVESLLAVAGGTADRSSMRHCGGCECGPEHRIQVNGGCCMDGLCGCAPVSRREPALLPLVEVNSNALFFQPAARRQGTTSSGAPELVVGTLDVCRGRC